MRVFFTILLLTSALCSFGKVISADSTFKINAVGPTTICGNDSVNIVATGCSGNIIWSNGSTDNYSIRVNQSGNYSATCVPTSEVSNIITVTILTTPNPPTISLEIINSQNVLTASGCTGDVVWNTNESGTTIIATVGGSYYAFCRPTGSTNCGSSPSNIFNVSAPIPTISANKTKLCIGENAILTAAGCLGTITWSNGFTGTTISISAVGNYSAYCLQNGIQSSESNIILITALEATRPNIFSPENNYCLNPTVTLAASTCPDGTIIWSNGSIGTSISISVTGTYSATCQNQCGNSQSSNVITVSPSGSSGIVPTTPTLTSTKINICTGETVDLTASGCNTNNLLWNNGMTSSLITVSQAGSYSAICQGQCSNSEVSNLIILGTSSIPTFPIITSNKTTLCNNETAILIATNCNGNLIWNNGMTTSSIQISQAGNYTVTCNNSCGAAGSQPYVISNSTTVVASPIITTNKTILCNGENATLIASGCSGNVLWSTNASGTSIQLAISGTFTAICQNACGNSGNSSPIILRANNAPTTPTATTNKIIICNGETATLTANGCNGTFLWNNGATVTSISVTVAGTYRVACQNICGNSIPSNEVIINSSSTPTAPIITTNKLSICGTEVATLTSIGCYNSVIWSNGATGTSTQMSKSGIYTALCDNVCGTSTNSNALNITQLTNQCTPISISKVK